jgi:hypothetical protein
MPYEEAILLDVRQEWIVEEKKPGVRALCEFGKMVSKHGPLPCPGDIPLSFRSHCLDGVLDANVYYVFDLPVFEGRDIRNRPLHERRALLWSLALPAWFRLIPAGQNIGEFLEAVERDGGEGVVLKSLMQPYGSAEWIKVVPAQREAVVVLECHEKERSARVGQFADGKLVSRGMVFLGSLYHEAWPGQVMEVTVNGRHPTGTFRQVRFVRFCPEKLATECVVRS